MFEPSWIISLKQQLTRFGLNPSDWEITPSLDHQNWLLTHTSADWKLIGRVVYENQMMLWQRLELY